MGASILKFFCLRVHFNKIHKFDVINTFTSINTFRNLKNFKIRIFFIKLFLGYGGLSVSVEGPSKVDLRCDEVKEGFIKISYRPTEPGIYILAIKFADMHVQG